MPATCSTFGRSRRSLRFCVLGCRSSGRPLTHSVYEARRMGQVARQYKVATQMGNQGTATDGIREGAEYVRSGGLGKVKEIHAWTNRPVWPQAPSIVARPTEKQDVPSHMDWNSFIGPAPMRPYHSSYTPFKWRGWWDYGTGALGDMACHTTNLAFMGCELTQPTTVESVNTGPINAETFPSIEDTAPRGRGNRRGDPR